MESYGENLILDSASKSYSSYILTFMPKHNLCWIMIKLSFLALKS